MHDTPLEQEGVYRKSCFLEVLPIFLGDVEGRVAIGYSPICANRE